MQILESENLEMPWMNRVSQSGISACPFWSDEA